MKMFCIAGPIIPEDNYYIPKRLNWDELESFIQQKFYFVLHAPRQSGKTSAIEEFVHYLNKQDKYIALYINIEAAQAARDNIELALIAIVELLANKIGQGLRDHDHVVEQLYCMIKEQTFILELKIKYGEDTLHRGLDQVAEYLDISNANEGHLIIFDRDSSKTWEEKISHETIEYKSKKIDVWTL